MGKRMKVFIILLISLSFLGFSWEGELDPNEFDKWELISTQPTPQGLLWMYMKNPDEASPIDIVAMAIDMNATLLGYRYFKNGKPYSFVFDDSQEKYVERHFTDEQINACMKCHQDKLGLRI